MNLKRPFHTLMIVLLFASLSCSAVSPLWATSTSQPSLTLTLTPRPSATWTPAATSTTTPTVTPTEGPIGEFQFGEIAALDYPRAEWQVQDHSLKHLSLPDCSILPGGASEADLTNVVLIGAYRWLIAYNGAYTLQNVAGEAPIVMQLGKKPSACKQAIETLMKSVHEFSTYAQSGECRYAPKQRLKVGVSAAVRSSSYLRTEPRWAEETRVRLVAPAEKLTVKITGGPVCGIYNKGEYSYWQVELSSGEKGWMAEGDLNEYYLAPKK